MIGKLDRRITFIEPDISTGTSNEDKITGWTEITSNPTVWASFSQSRGNTQIDGDRVAYAQTTTFIIRYREDLNVMMRVVDEDTKVYAILSIGELNGSRKRYTSIAAVIINNENFT